MTNIGKLVCCDGLKTVPEASWFCDECIAAGKGKNECVDWKDDGDDIADNNVAGSGSETISDIFTNK